MAKMCRPHLLLRDESCPAAAWVRQEPIRGASRDAWACSGLGATAKCRKTGALRCPALLQFSVVHAASYQVMTKTSTCEMNRPAEWCAHLVELRLPRRGFDRSLLRLLETMRRRMCWISHLVPPQPSGNETWISSWRMTQTRLWTTIVRHRWEDFSLHKLHNVDVHAIPLHLANQ